MIQVKLMTNSNYPIIYGDKHEQEALAKFREAIRGKETEFTQAFSSQNHVYSIRVFVNWLDKNIDLQSFKISDENIDTLFVMLCRGVSFDKVREL